MVEVQKMNEVRQLNSKVNEEKRYLNKLYLEMGKKLYDKYKDADTAPEGFEAEFRKITERYSVMDLLQDEDPPGKRRGTLPLLQHGSGSD